MEVSRLFVFFGDSDGLLDWQIDINPPLIIFRPYRGIVLSSFSIRVDVWASVCTGIVVEVLVQVE